ncbi:MAG: DUF2436 domain-containing protein, partial [Bacteroidales bacterium]|nr:DUF2436 domain-containing protein [Bacteroidales bacterium]
MKVKLHFTRILLVLIAFLGCVYAFPQAKEPARKLNKFIPAEVVKSRTGNKGAKSKVFPFAKKPADGNVTIILEAHDVWGDGTGYQMLLDATATAYGTIIPIVGPLTNGGDVPDSIYNHFEYKIPVNADGSLTTQNMVFDGAVAIEVPAGTYDWCITNPTPGGCMWIASNSCEAGRADNYVFEAGSTYLFYISYNEDAGQDCVTTTITTDENAPGAPTGFSVTPAPDQGFSATLTWTNPTTTLNGAPLTSISMVVVERNGVALYTINNPVPGSVSTWEDITIPATDQYNYTVYATNEAGTGVRASVTAWIGALYYMPVSGTETISICEGVIFDDGGPNNPYSSDCYGDIIINPIDANHGVQIHGIYATETDCDYLYVFEGAGTSGTLLNVYSLSEGGEIPLTSSMVGPLTLHFESDGSVEEFGFVIYVSCMEINPNCLPPMQLSCTGVSSTTAQVTWQAHEGQSLWDIEYGPIGFTQGQGTVVMADSNPFTLTGLSEESGYNFYVRANCGELGVSIWNGPATFLTAMGCDEGIPAAPIVGHGIT